MNWKNTFAGVPINAKDLASHIEKHDGSEAFHDPFDTCGDLFRPALGYVWFDFRSGDGGVASHEDAKKFLNWLEIKDALTIYSGARTFHVGVPFCFVGLPSSKNIRHHLKKLCLKLKEQFPSLDTEIYDEGKQTRVLGSKHPRGKLYKTQCDFSWTLEQIESKAFERLPVVIPRLSFKPSFVEPLSQFADLLTETLADEFIPTEINGFYNVSIGDKGIKRTPNYKDLLKAFIRERPYKTICDMKAVYTFNGKFYEETTPIEIKCFSESKFDPEPQEKIRQEFYSKVLANSPAKRIFFTETTHSKINFNNGWLDLSECGSQNSTASLQVHDPKIGFRGVLPFDYCSTAVCPTFESWILDVMLGDQKLIAILQEYMGYVVRGGDYQFHKALWLSGSGRNGKSTFLSVLKALIGTGNYSTLSIRQIISDKFSSADLDGKIANFSEETSPEELSDSGPFKNLTGDGELLAQKKYGDPYSFRNRAKLIMTYNEVPILKDLSPGMLSRPIIIPWRKDLTDEASQDKTLLKRLTAELPGIFNFALDGWRRLERQGMFTQSPESQISMRDVEAASCSATRWVEEEVTFTQETVVTYSLKEMYAAYRRWQTEAGGQPLGEPKFIKRIGCHAEIKKRKRHTKYGNEYFGLRIGARLGIVSSFQG